VLPLWVRDGTLVYKVVLPLVENSKYVKYEIQSWPVPYEEVGLTAKILVPAVVAMDTIAGTVCTPHDCLGRRPTVCRTGPQYTGVQWACVRGILTGQDVLRKHCKLTIKRAGAQQVIQEVYPGEYVLVTWDTSITVRCLGKRGRPDTLKEGVYHVLVPETCRIHGEGWVLPGLMKRTVNRTLLARRVAVPSLSIPHLMPEKVASKMVPLEADGLSPEILPKELTLSKMDIPPEIHIATVSKWKTYGIGIPAVCLAIGIAVLCILARKGLLPKCKSPKGPGAKDEIELQEMKSPEEAQEQALNELLSQ